MNKTITLELRPEDAEPILRKAAQDAAKWGALLDYATRKTGNLRDRGYGESYEDARKRWQQSFIKAKRMVEAFGVEYEQTSEAEALTVDYRLVGGKVKVLNLSGSVGKVGVRTGGEFDYKHPYPAFRGEVHSQACYAAADRVVRKWRALIE